MYHVEGNMFNLSIVNLIVSLWIHKDVFAQILLNNFFTADKRSCPCCTILSFSLFAWIHLQNYAYDALQKRREARDRFKREAGKNHEQQDNCPKEDRIRTRRGFFFTGW